ncbi:MAG: hypothetical protein JJT93_13695 [Gammaproteobacteria bacterium]|nr:hypothetical protein [Gammaproteobacteria bacterium]
MGEWFSQYPLSLLLIAAGIVVAVVLTLRVLSRRRNLDRGPEKGTAANPRQVKRDNPPD